MSPTNQGDGTEQQIQAVVEAFLARRQAGEEPDLHELILAHPAIAAELERRLRAAEWLLALAREHDSAGRGAPRSGGGDRRPASLGRYRILGVLGRGASSMVYRAYDPKFQREVALKVLWPERLAAADWPERFERGARLSAGLRHQNIVPIHETGEHEGCCYIDMELIEGEALDQRLRRGPLEKQAAAELAYRLALALQHAHEKGIVHRDLKPSNILLDAQGQPQLTDFGLARGATEPSLTAAGQIIGTPAYMSPEQADGRGHQADARSDIYGLGAVLYCLLTGRAPFDSCDALPSLLARIIAEEPPRPRTLNPAIPRELETICLKAMAKAPAERFATARALADELWRWLQDEPLTIRPPTRWQRLRRWARGHRPLTRLAAAAVLLLAVVSASLGGLAWDQREKAHRAEQVQLQAEAHAETARQRQRLEAEKRAEFEAWSLLNAAWQRLRRPTWGRRREAQALLARVAAQRRLLREPAVIDQLDRGIRSVLATSLGVPDLEVHSHAELPDVFYRAWPAAFHPDGQTLVLGTHLGPVRWVRGQSLRLPRGLDPKRPRPSLLFSPDGQYLVLAPADGGLELWDGQVAECLVRMGRDEKGRYLGLAFAETGREVWACREDGLVQSWSLPDGHRRRRWSLAAEPEASLTAACFNADATLLAVGRDNGQVRLFRRGQKQPFREVRAGRFEVESLAWSPNGRLVAAGTEDGRVLVWDRDGTPFHQLTVPSHGVGVLHFTPDGCWLLAGGRTGEMTVWDACTGERLLTGPHLPWAFARDGRRFAGTSGNQAAFCELLLPEEVGRLRGHQSGVEQLAWSRRNHHLASLDSRFEACVWDVRRRRLVTSFPAPLAHRRMFSAANAAIALSDDGQLLGYASGGEKSLFLLHDVRTGAAVGRWDLPAGFERLTWAQGAFVLVREEEADEGRRNWHGVVRAFQPDHPPAAPRIIRPHVAGEESFFDAGLTADGRLYWWVGPRRPSQNLRVEVREVASGRLVQRVPCPRDHEEQNWNGHVLLDDRCLWVETGDERWRGYDLAEGRLVAGPPPLPSRSPDLRWRTAPRDLNQPSGALGLGLYRLPDRGVWLDFLEGDAAPGRPHFSPDGRYLAWVSPCGAITVADLPRLEQTVRAFEQSLRGP